MKKSAFFFILAIIFMFDSCYVKDHHRYSFTGRVYDLSSNINYEGIEMEVDFVSSADDCKHCAGVAAKVKVGKDGYFTGTHAAVCDCSAGYLDAVMKFSHPEEQYYSYEWGIASGINRFSKEWDNVNINLSSLGWAKATINLKDWKKGDIVYYQAGYNYNGGILNQEPVRTITPDSNIITISFKSYSKISGLTYTHPRPIPYLHIGYNSTCLYNRNGEMVPKDSIALPYISAEPAVTNLSYTY